MISRDLHAASLTTSQILKMMEAFKEGNTLHIKHAWQLIKEAKDIFAKEETLQASDIFLLL